MDKPKVFIVCDWFDKKASECGAWNVGIEFMGNCTGRILHEDGTEIGRHNSSSFGWLRNDLLRKLKDVGGAEQFEIVDLIGQEVPERFKAKGK